jgi:nitroreductase
MTTEKQMELILGRRSVRVFAPGEIENSVLEMILEGAMAAPSAMTRDPWRFVTVRQADTLKQLASACPGGSMLPSAGLAIVVCGDQQAAFEQKIGYLIQDCSASIENLLLSAHALGLGSCWVGVYPEEASMRKVRDAVNLPASVVPVAVIALGYPGEQLPPRTRFNAGYVHAEKW